MCSVLCGCIGGPISDLPNSRGGEKPSGDNVTNPGQGDNGNAGGGMSGEWPPSPGGGANNPGRPGDDPSAGDGDSDWNDADAGAGNPGPGPTAPECEYVPPDGSEACGGAYCGLSAAELESQVMPGGACVTDQAELALVCNSTLPVTVSRCFQDALGAGVFSLAEVETCATGAPELAAASTDCVRCYLEETRCALTHCLLYCLFENGEADCKSCRETHCGEAFRACSGLPVGP